MLRRASQVEVEGQWRKGRSRGHEGRQVEEECMKFGLSGEDMFCRSLGLFE